MKKYARIDDSVVVEIIESDDLAVQFHPEIAKLFVQCDDVVCLGMIFDGKTFCESVLPKSNVDLAAEQYKAIDTHIAQCIKSNGWDYDNLGEVAAYALLSEEYKNEAKAIWEWVEECHSVQSDIKNGVKKYDSVEAALKALPPFDVHE
jgi:hypothetical protein